jgi:hypothetical protein
MKLINLSGHAECGKTTVAKMLKEELQAGGKKVLLMSYAGYLKYICQAYFGWDGKKDETGRKLLQYVGTDLVRKRDPDFWVKTIVDFVKVFGRDFDFIIMDDCRFVNEVEYPIIHFVDACSVRINRPEHVNSLTEQQRLHPSEIALDDYNKFDYSIINPEGLDNLKSIATKLANTIDSIYTEKEL